MDKHPALGTDEQLMALVSGGDLRAFETLVDKYKDRMINFISRSIADPSTAEDVFQELFIRVFHARHEYKPTAAFSTWLYTIAHNLCYNARRDNLHHDRAVSLEQPLSSSGQTTEKTLQVKDTIQDQGDDPLQNLGLKEREGLVKRAISELPKDYREFLILKHYEGLDYGAIASIMGGSKDSVKMRAVRARKALKEKLEELIGSQ